MPEPEVGHLAEDVTLGSFSDSESECGISHILDEDELIASIKPAPKAGRRVFVVAVAAVVLVLLVAASLTIPSKGTSPRLLLLQLETESELNRLAEAISCPPYTCKLLESASFAGVPAALWLVSMDTQSPAQALSGLNADTPYFLLLRNDNRSSEFTDSVSSVEDLLGLLAYTVVLPPRDSLIAAVLSNESGNRRLLNDKHAYGDDVTDSESAEESPADVLLPGTASGFNAVDGGQSLGTTLWGPDGKPPPTPQCRNITTSHIQSAGGVGGGTSQTEAVSAADAQQVRNGEDFALLFGPFVFPQGATVGLRLDVWLKDAGDTDAAESRALAVNVHQAHSFKAHDEWWRDTHSIEVTPTSPSAALRACHATQKTFTLHSEGYISTDTDSNSPSAPEYPPPLPPPASPPPPSSSDEVISQGTRSTASNSSDPSQPPSPPPLAPSSPPSPTESPPHPATFPSPPQNPPTPQQPSPEPPRPPVPSVPVEQAPPGPAPPSPSPPSSPLQPPQADPAPLHPPPAPAFVLPDEGGAFYPTLMPPPPSTDPSADAPDDSSSDSNPSPPNRPSDAATAITEPVSEGPQQPDADLRTPPSPPPALEEVHDSSSGLPQAPSNGTSAAPLQPTSGTEEPSELEPPVTRSPVDTASGADANSDPDPSPAATLPSPAPASPTSSASPAANVPAPEMPPPSQQAPPQSPPAAALSPPTAAADVITQSFPNNNPPPQPPPSEDELSAPSTPPGIPPSTPPGIPPSPPAADVVVTQSIPAGSPPPPPPASGTPSPEDISAGDIIQTVTSSSPPPPSPPISTPSSVNTALITQTDASSPGIPVTLSDQVIMQSYAEVPSWLKDVPLPGMVLSRVALQPLLATDNQGVVVSLVGGGFTSTGNLYSGDRYTAVATLVQYSSRSIVVVRPAAEVFRSLLVQTTDTSANPSGNSRRLASQLNSNHELGTDLGPISAGNQQLQLDLEFHTGTIIRIQRAFHVEQGQSNPTEGGDDGEVFDMSQSEGGTQGDTSNEPQARSKSRASILKPQRLVFVIIGPLMIIPVVAGVLLLLSKKRKRRLAAENQTEQQDEDTQAAGDNTTSDTPDESTECPVSTVEQCGEACGTAARQCDSPLQRKTDGAEPSQLALPRDGAQNVPLQQHLEIQSLQPGSEGLCLSLSAADMIAAESRAAPRILKTPAGASKSTNPLFESDCDMIPPHADAPSTPTRRPSANVDFGGACAAGAQQEMQQDGAIDCADACGEGLVEVAGQCSMDMGALVASPLRPSTSASQPPRSPASMALRESLPGTITGCEVPPEYS